VGTHGFASAGWSCKPLEPITLHGPRHTFASLMIRAGVNAKALATYMGHLDRDHARRYGYLMPGNESEAAVLLDALLGGAETSPAAKLRVAR
jgi:integrase